MQKIRSHNARVSTVTRTIPDLRLQSAGAICFLMKRAEKIKVVGWGWAQGHTLASVVVTVWMGNEGLWMEMQLGEERMRDSRLSLKK